MGQAVDDMLEGLVCQECGEWMDDFESPGYPRTCEGCLGQSSRSYHVKAQPSAEKPRLICLICVKGPKGERKRRISFTSDEGRNAHMRDAHPKMACPDCDRTFIGPYSLEQHRMAKHGLAA